MQPARPSGDRRRARPGPSSRAPADATPTPPADPWRTEGLATSAHIRGVLDHRTLLVGIPDDGLELQITLLGLLPLRRSAALADWLETLITPTRGRCRLWLPRAPYFRRWIQSVVTDRHHGGLIWLGPDHASIGDIGGTLNHRAAVHWPRLRDPQCPYLGRHP